MKSKIRKKILAKRNALPPEAVLDAEIKIINQLRYWSIYIDAEYVMTYVDFRNEIKTHRIMKDLIINRKNLVVPLTNRDSTDIRPVQISSFDELTTGQFGLSEPSKESKEFNPKLLDLILVPGIAFDLFGNRIGFGKGYYDNFLARLNENIPCAALAYDFQVLDYKIPHNEHDIPMDYIITPTRTIKTGRKHRSME